MHPSRELDKLIAEKVFGLIVDFDNDRWFDGTQVAENKDDFGKYDLVRSISGGTSMPRTRSLPHYSTDIYAAWQVVDKIHSSFFNDTYEFGYWDGNNFKIRLKLILYKEEIGYEARFMDEQNNTAACGAGETAPHAICLAALRCVDVLYYSCG